MKDFERITRLEGEVLSLTNRYTEMANNFKELAVIQNKCFEQIDLMTKMVELNKLKITELENKVNFMWLVFKTGQ